MDKYEQKKFDESLREKEIKRLTSPLIEQKFGPFTTKVVDIEGNAVPVRRSTLGGYFDTKYIMEPKKGIISDDDILKYAAESEEASRIRLKRGIGTFEDKKLLYGKNFLFWGWLIGMFDFILIGGGIIGNNLIMSLLGIMILLLILGYASYIFYIKDYSEGIYKKTKFTNENHEDTDTVKEASLNNNLIKENPFKNYEDQIKSLGELYHSKEKIVVDLIEKKFSPSELSYDKFMSVIMSSSKLFNEEVESALNIINLTSSKSEKVENEIKNKINIMKIIIEKIDELTNEIVLNMNASENNKDFLVEELENLIESVKNYK